MMMAIHWGRKASRDYIQAPAAAAAGRGGAASAPGSKRKATSGASTASSAGATSGPEKRKRAGVSPLLESQAGMAGMKAELSEEGLSTVGSATELAARLAEHGNGWTVPVSEVKAEPEEPVVQLEWIKWDSINDKSITHTMFADEIPAGDEVSSSRVITGGEAACESGDDGEYHLSVRLLSNKKEKNLVAEIEVHWWLGNGFATLMHFNALSGDLASFCETLWASAGRRDATTT